MLKKDITYTNPFTEQESTETHYFHISKADLIEMEMEEHNLAYKAKDGQDYTGMQAKLMKIIDAEDGKAIIASLKDIVRRSYGQKVGERFLKSPGATQEFMSSEAFSQLLYELCTDAEKAAEFTNGVIPANLAQEAQAIARQSADISDREEAQAESPSLKAVEDLADRTGTDFPKTGDEKLQGGYVAAEPRLLSDAELREMDPGELRSGLAEGRYKLS